MGIFDKSKMTDFEMLNFSRFESGIRLNGRLIMVIEFY